MGLDEIESKVTIAIVGAIGLIFLFFNASNGAYSIDWNHFSEYLFGEGRTFSELVWKIWVKDVSLSIIAFFLVITAIGIWFYNDGVMNPIAKIVFGICALFVLVFCFKINIIVALILATPFVLLCLIDAIGDLTFAIILVCVAALLPFIAFLVGFIAWLYWSSRFLFSIVLVFTVLALLCGGAPAVKGIIVLIDD